VALFDTQLFLVFLGISWIVYLFTIGKSGQRSEPHIYTYGVEWLCWDRFKKSDLEADEPFTGIIFIENTGFNGAF
jgi:hypothetical protein